jgi:hypothetical protein
MCGAGEDEPLFVQARNELARIEKEEVLLKSLEDAISTGAVTPLGSTRPSPTPAYFFAFFIFLF